MDTEIVIPHESYCCRHTGDEELYQIIEVSFRSEVFGVKILDNCIKSFKIKRTIKIIGKSCKPLQKWPLIEPRRLHLAILLKQFFAPYEKNFSRHWNCWVSPKSLNATCYATKLNPSEIPDDEKTCYFPHFDVLNINKPGKMTSIQFEWFSSSLSQLSMISVLCRYNWRSPNCSAVFMA